MTYVYKCIDCNRTWEHKRPLADCDKPSICYCGKTGQKVLSTLPSYFNKTHPDIKQDMHELIAGVPGNIGEI